MQESEENSQTTTPESPIDLASKAIAEADQITRKEPKKWKEAIAKLDEAVKILEEAEDGEKDRKAHMTGWARMGKGNILVNTSTRENLDIAIEEYEAALKCFEGIADRNASQDADIAAVLGNIGHARFRIGEPDQILKSENLYRRAIAILECLPWKENARYRHHLSATWLNLANTLARQNKPTEPSQDAIDAFEKALDFTSEFAAEDNSFGMLRANIRASLGRALQWSQTKEHLERAVREFEGAIVILEKLPHDKDPRVAIELAAAHGHRANLLSRAQPTQQSIQATLKSGEVALQIAGPNEQKNLLAAEIALNARRAVCHVFGIIIGHQEAKAKNEIQDKATDLIEDGLKIVRLWDKRGAHGFRPAAHHLFHLGCAFYASQQPQFLNEFLGEYLIKGDPIMLESAKNAIKQALENSKDNKKFDTNAKTQLKARLEVLEG